MTVYDFIGALGIITLALVMGYSLYSMGTSVRWSDASKGDKLARVLRILLALFSLVMISYAFSQSDDKNHKENNQTISAALEDKYGLRLTEKELSKLTYKLEAYSRSFEPPFILGAIEMGGKPYYVIYREKNDLYLVDFSDNSISELQNKD